MENAVINFSPASFPDFPKLPDQHDGPLVYNDLINSFVMQRPDVSIYQPILIEPAHFDKLPIMVPIESDWCFNIELNSESASKTSWMFSTKLNKVFVKINTFLSVHAKYTVIDPDQSLYVRAMIVYSSPNELAEPVKKCPNHRSQSTQDYPEHVLRCEVKETEYVGEEEGKLFKNKLALRIPMNAVASNEALKLTFSCQNSCSGGMNRKMTSIVFTLENERYDILGRRVLNFKVCSCPKRDKEKDEESTTKTLPKKRKGEALASTSKKVAIQVPIVKQEAETTMSAITEPMLTSLPSDLQSLNSGLLELKREPQAWEIHCSMPDQETKLEGLRSLYNIISGQMHRTGDASCQRYLNDLQKQIGKWSLRFARRHSNETMRLISVANITDDNL